MRDRDTTGDGTLDERLYGLQDANWNMVALIDPTATVEERFVYSPYGTPMFLSSAWSPTSDSFLWEYLFTGYSYDHAPGIYVVRNRQYTSVLGRWNTRDDIGYVDDASLYTYVGSSPLSGADPFGQLDINLSFTNPFTGLAGLLCGSFTLDFSYAVQAPIGIYQIINNIKEMQWLQCGFPFVLGLAALESQLQYLIGTDLSLNTVIICNSIGVLQNRCCPIQQIQLSAVVNVLATISLPNPWAPNKAQFLFGLQLPVGGEIDVGICLPSVCPCPQPLPPLKKQLLLNDINLGAPYNLDIILLPFIIIDSLKQLLP